MRCCGDSGGFAYGHRDEDHVVDGLDDSCVTGQHNSFGRDMYREANDDASTQRVDQADNDGTRVGPRCRPRHFSNVGNNEHLAGRHMLTEL